MKSFNEMSDVELFRFCILFLNGADLSIKENIDIYLQFKKEVFTRNNELQKQIKEIEDVL